MGKIADTYYEDSNKYDSYSAYVYAALVALEERIDALQPPQPTPDSTGKVEGWMTYDPPGRVWFCERDCNGKWVVETINSSNLELGDLWQFYIPGEPAPAAPETSVK